MGGQDQATIRMRISPISYNSRMEARPTVALLTGSYPYGLAEEDSFLVPELPHLQREFARVFVVPAARGGKRADLPPGIDFDDSLAIDLAARPGPLKTLRTALACPPIPGEIWRRFRALRSLVALRRLVAFAAAASRVAHWYEGFAERHRLDPRSTILYTYWFDALSAGLLLARMREPSLVVVSRGHRFDIYEEHQSPPYLPCRQWLMNHIDRLFLVSDTAHSYVLSRHPEAADRLVVSRLGTPEPGFLASPSADGVLRVVSCSALIPVKRVDVLARGLKLAAYDRPDRPIEWHHIGDGPLRGEIETVLMESAPPNLSWDFSGHVAHTDVFGRYRSHRADLFANTSQTEGIPLAIMEAQSCGIPAMAPAVGGVPEIVSPENGFLLPSAATPRAIADAVAAVLRTPQCLGPRRERSRRDWEDRFDASRNFAAFARGLSDLRSRLGGMTA